MNYHSSTPALPAPCIIDTGMLINKDDMRRLLNDLGQVHYIYSLDNEVQSEGEGWVLEVFADSQQATIVTNQSLYLNVYSFDYLKLSREDDQSIIDLIQDGRKLRLSPLSSISLANGGSEELNISNLEAMVTQVLAAKWDVQVDDQLLD